MQCLGLSSVSGSPIRMIWRNAMPRTPFLLNHLQITSLDSKKTLALPGVKSLSACMPARSLLRLGIDFCPRCSLQVGGWRGMCRRLGAGCGLASTELSLAREPLLLQKEKKFFLFPLEFSSDKKERFLLDLTEPFASFNNTALMG